MHFIAVTGFKGGVAKTTSALHLARFLSERGTTLLIDGDPNASCRKWHERASRRDDWKPPFECVSEKMAATRIAAQNFVVIDTPARPDSNDLREITANAALTVLPSAPETMALEAMLEMLPHLHPEATFRCLLTLCPPKPSQEPDKVRAALVAADFPVFQAQVRRAAAFGKASALGLTVAEMSGRERSPWNDYSAVGKELLEAIHAQK